MNKKIIIIVLLIILIILCIYFIISKNKIVPLEEPVNQNETEVSEDEKDMPSIKAGELATEKSKYTDENGDVAIIPKDFKVSTNKEEQIINSGLVIIGPDESEFVWIPTTKTEFKRNNFSTRYYNSM